MDQALIIVISVLTSVATLLLISVGLAVIFGLMRVINLAHGEFLMLRAYAVLIIMALITLTAVYLLFTRTRYGVMARAAIQNPAMARALGIDTARMNMLTFGIGSGLAGLAGALLAPVAGVVPSFGQAYIAQAFMTVIVGGPDVITGTSAAAGLLGGSYSLVSYFTTPFIGQAALLVIAIVLLRVLPQGLSGNWRTYL